MPAWPAVAGADALLRALGDAAAEMGDPVLVAWVQSLAAGDRMETVKGLARDLPSRAR